MTTVIDVPKHGVAAVCRDEEIARFAPDAVTRTFRPNPFTSVEKAGDRISLLVEVLRRLGGHAPRALLGGQFVFGAAEGLTLQVNVTRQSKLSGSCPSRLWASNPLTIGLPDVYAEAVTAGLEIGIGKGIPSGVLTIDQAAFDEIESSPRAFSQAAALLGIIVAADSNGQDAEADARKYMTTW